MFPQPPQLLITRSSTGSLHRLILVNACTSHSRRCRKLTLPPRRLRARLGLSSREWRTLSGARWLSQWSHQGDKPPCLLVKYRETVIQTFLSSRRKSSGSAPSRPWRLSQHFTIDCAGVLPHTTLRKILQQRNRVKTGSVKGHFTKLTCSAPSTFFDKQKN